MEVSDTVISYASSLCYETPEMAKLRRFNSSRPDHKYQTTKHQAAFLAFLVDLTNAMNIIEVGTYTGYSAAMMAHQLDPLDGVLYAYDTNFHYLQIAEQAWEEIGVSDRIVPVYANALEAQQHEVALKSERSLDMVYIDVERMALLPMLYEKFLGILRLGGLMAIDNVFWAGEVTSKSKDPVVSCIQEFNEFVRDDDRVHAVTVPGLGDGLTLVTKIA